MAEFESETSSTGVVVVSPPSGLVSEILSGMSECKHFNEVKLQLERICSKEISPRLSPEEQDKAQRWLRWAGQRQHLKLVKAPVPPGILPDQVTAELTDVKVFTKRGPDDVIFEKNKDIREKVARGNCFLRVSGKKESSTSCVVYALKKFTGGLGDDDDKDKGDNFTWKKFFTKSLDETEKVICTRKANGEAAHLSCVEIAGELFICGGSKNVHMLIKKRDDIELYDGPRFRIAKEVCSAIMDFLDSMSAENKQRLLQFLAVTRLTTIFEILSPLHQHVEDLSYLKSGELVFITWTSVELEPVTDAQLCPLPPHVAIEVARQLGLRTVDYDVIPYAHVEERMTQVRHGYQYEGEVFYFLDNNSNVIGLLKKKTVWYIICRAIREKARHVTADLAKSPETFSLSTHLARVDKRLTAIQSWLDLDEAVVSSWKELGAGFIRWLVAKVTDKELGPEDIADMFPVTWNKFLQDKDLNDRIEVRVIADGKT